METAPKLVVEEEYDDAEFAYFDQIIYLGCTSIDEPKSETAIERAMKELNDQHSKNSDQENVDVTLAVPFTSLGDVKIFDRNSYNKIDCCLAVYPVRSILFCARGRPTSTPDASNDETTCFAFTRPGRPIDDSVRSGTNLENFDENSTYFCHVFRCKTQDTVGKILLHFAAVFKSNSDFSPRKRLANENSSSTNTVFEPENQNSDIGQSQNPISQFEFDVFLEIKEEDEKGAFVLMPQDKNCFKLRRNREKRLQVALQQTSGSKILHVQKCFGLLLAAGRYVKHCDMHLLDLQSTGRGNDDKTFLIEAFWDPNSPQFEALNTETPKDTRVYMTVAADVVLSGVHEPVRFSLECKARVYHQHERFWYVTRKALVERYYLTVKRTVRASENAPDTDSAAVQNSSPNSPRPKWPSSYEVLSCLSATERDRQNRRLSSAGRSPSKMATNLVAPPDDDDSDSDEPLLSGSGGEALGSCDAETMDEWRKCLDEWCRSEAVESEDQNPENLNENKESSPSAISNQRRRPEQISRLIVRSGVPDSLRCKVWPLLAGCYQDPEMADTYRLLLSKECPNEQVILRDIHRTFPAHEFFKEAGGVGQEALYKISKAYSLYDEDVGYCQGLSFLAASLLLHIQEEQAFGVLVKIMFDYGLRDLFKRGFEALHLRFYQLDRLIEDYIPDLYQHFQNINVETHMYASQWFLTLFTAKFSLSMVFRIIDLFLCEGMNTIFHISIALLKAWKRQLMEMDFEGALKYFRVVLPRKYRTEYEAQELIQQAEKLQISHKRLSKYEKQFIAMKNREVESQDPVERLEKECMKLRESLMRLERENDDLAHELVTSKIQLRKNLDAAEDNIESLQNQMEKMSDHCREGEENQRRLLAEAEQVKEMCRREIQRVDEENLRCAAIIANYKQICTNLNVRLEEEQEKKRRKVEKLMSLIKLCPSCSTSVSAASFSNNETPPDQSTPDDDYADSSKFDDNDFLNSAHFSTNRNDDQQIRRLELELARTKLALVESECKNQDLNHQLQMTSNSAPQKKVGGVLENSAHFRERGGVWLKKTLNSLKNAAPAYPLPPNAHHFDTTFSRSSSDSAGAEFTKN